MLSVIEVEKKRQKLRSLPPGLHNTQTPNDKNSQLPKNTNNQQPMNNNKNWNSQPPKNENIQHPQNRNILQPKNENIQPPKNRNSQLPKNVNSRSPRNTNRQRPRNITSQLLRNGNVQPPTNKNNQPAKNENNSSKVSGCGTCSCHVRGPSRVTAEKGLTTRVHMKKWKPGEVDPCSPMMPVEQVTQKRSRFKSDPPGFHTTPKVDLNNNSKESEKLTSKLNKFGASFWEKVSGKAPGEESENKQSKLKSFLGSNLKDMGSSLIEMGINLKDRGFNLKDFGFNLKDMLNLYASKDKAGHLKCPTRTQEIVGVVATINYLEATGRDHHDWTYVLDDRLSPENYGETVRYYEDVIASRQDILRAIYVLGDMLVMDELEGEKDAWMEYTEKCAEEEKAWKEKCKASQAMFDKSRRVLGQRESFFQRSRRLLSDVTEKARNACPCLFGK